MNLVAFAMIVGNEEACVLRCLEAWSSLFSYFCIQCNGSDNTEAIARKYLETLGKPFHIISQQIKPFDFSRARNMIADYLNDKVDFVFMTDCDDLPGDNFMFPDFSKDVYSYQYRTGPDTWHKNFRLFRTQKGIRYRGPIHEVLYWDSDCVTQDLPCAVIHSPLPQKQSAPDRNLTLLQLQMPELRTIFYYAQELRDNGKYAEAVHYYKEYIWRAKKEGYWWEELLVAYIQAARYESDFHECVKLCIEGLAVDSNCAELWAELSYRHNADNVKAEYYKDKQKACIFKERLFVEKRFYVV